MKLKLISLSVCTLLCLMSASVSQPSPDLVHKWKVTWCGFASFAEEYDKFSEVERANYQNKIKKSFVRFKSNKTYSMQVFNAKDRGTWTIEQNKLFLKSKGGAKVEFLIKKNARKAFTLYNIQQKDTLLIQIKR